VNLYGRSPAAVYRRSGAALTRITGVAVILIVEDEASVAELIAETLIQRGHEARVAVSAAHASMLVSTERPDLILLDINLPDSSGTFTLGRLRQLRPDVPIIMLTANTDDELARATFRRGAFDYISKPFNIDHLVQVVEIALAS
jgi:two-component system, NtrC family, nitrogen regulation response regulator NtrX